MRNPTSHEVVIDDLLSPDNDPISARRKDTIRWSTKGKEAVLILPDGVFEEPVNDQGKKGAKVPKNDNKKFTVRKDAKHDSYGYSISKDYGIAALKGDPTIIIHNDDINS